MKNVLGASVLFALVLTSCSNGSNSDGLTLQANISEPTEGTVYLTKFQDGEEKFLDSAEIVDGHFTLSYPELDQPQSLFLRLPGNPRPIFFYGEKGTLTLEWMDVNSPPDFQGGAFQDSLEVINTLRMEQDNIMQGLVQEYQMAQATSDSAKMKQIEKDAKALQDNLQVELKKMAKRTGPLGAKIALEQLYDLDHQSLDTIYQTIPVIYAKAPDVVQLKEHIETLKKVSKGAPLTNLTMADTSGNMVSLTDIKAKYLLVDFWASWCGPCRQVNPDLVKLYNDFHDRGFDIVGVSLDENGDRWKQAIVQDSLVWSQMSDLKGWESEATRVYGLRFIPQNILVNQYGVIAQKNMTVDELREYLSEAL
ncbi:MAG: AhpC/TSA family protein [Bacteroidota bacterium]|mgnify:CR=1 FL=1|nr:AhpC/TSA family protein [Bacteroidota bacterium]MDX5404757.1 AhpC/TSA family protein [Bacteroidota bacterium]MDX5426782.1 AhpC/TSA family protein [Bacteroidota bacterium]MDX5448496.1 AhpC/TSA family protein [Bacteroidota bacterium]MDX5504770.1 AhpC/TSA family protein [Bacteroidota bacterium]